MPHGADPRPFDNTWTRWFFTVCILFMVYLGYLLVEPFLVQIFLAVVLVVAFAPLYAYFEKLFKGKRALASAMACIVIFIILAVPFFLLAGIITSQALDLYNTVSHMLINDQLQQTVRDGLGRLTPYLVELEERLGLEQTDVLEYVGELVREVSNLLYANLTGLLRRVTSLLIGTALVLFVTFFLLMDGEAMGEKLIALSPLPKGMNQKIKSDILSSLRATLKGTVVLAMIQGLAGGMGFYIFGVPNALFWGTVMVFASVVPLIGTALVWAPAGTYLILTGHVAGSIGMMIWCLLAGLTCDNILRPRLIAGQANLHPLLTFFSVLGGISLFGVVGLILGPLVLALLLSLLKVYQRFFVEEKPIEIKRKDKLG
ncbi:AI-2E family transporter [Dethiosulfatarculus sandiegensis]|nr:AI-2E family transporter [Dethiosulfatarculus sandiegensis]